MPSNLPPIEIYLSPPHMNGNEFEYLKAAFASNWITSLGPHLTKFEDSLRAYVGVKHGVALNSGTAAVQLALHLLNVQPGDYVLCSSFTFIASAAPIAQRGAIPIFIDSETATWNMDPELVAEEIEALHRRGIKPKAVLAVHLYGQSCNLDPLLATCKKWDIPLIEDAAESLGAKYKDLPTGTLGDFGIYSFNGNKIITTSGGGFLVGKNAVLIDKARFYATQAREPADHYEHQELGFNYRMSNLLAAIGLGQLEGLDDKIAARRKIFSEYHRRLHELDGFEFMPEPDYCFSNRWLTCITIDPEKSGKTRGKILADLRAAGIESRPLWKPMHLQPVFKEARVVGGKVSENLFANGLCLPSGSSLSMAQIDKICEIIFSS